MLDSDLVVPEIHGVIASNPASANGVYKFDDAGVSVYL